jgi:hypothetical protein
LGAFPISISKSIDERSNLPILTEYLMGVWIYLKVKHGRQVRRRERIPDILGNSDY